MCRCTSSRLVSMGELHSTSRVWATRDEHIVLTSTTKTARASHGAYKSKVCFRVCSPVFRPPERICRSFLADPLSRRHHLWQHLRQATEAPVGLRCGAKVHEVGIHVTRRREAAANPVHRYVDPTLSEDLASKSRPWAMSPFIATMPHIHHTRLEHGDEPPEFPAPFEPIAENMTHIRTRTPTARRHETLPPRHRKQRKAHFKNVEKRRDVVFGPNVRCRGLCPCGSPQTDDRLGSHHGRLLPPLSGLWPR